MATVGRGILQKAAFDLFDAMRSYDVKKAMDQLADEATWRSPFAEGELSGKPAIEAHLKAWLTDPKTRPSLTLRDVSGDGAVLHMDLSVSGRFGQEPRFVRMTLLCAGGKVHQVLVRDPSQAAH